MFFKCSSSKDGSTKGISCIFPNCPKWLPVNILLKRILSGSASIPIPSLILGFGTTNKFSFDTLQYQSPPSLATSSNLVWSNFLSSVSKSLFKCKRNTSHITSWPAPPSSPNDFTSSTLHSSFALLSFTMGGFISVAGSLVKPALMNSSVPLGYSQLASETCCTISYVTILITTSGTSITFCKECFVVLSLILFEGEKTTTGGSEETILKKLNGLRLTFPSLSMVDAKQIGLGAITCCR